jgi:hypothetical protein
MHTSRLTKANKYSARNPVSTMAETKDPALATDGVIMTTIQAPSIPPIQQVQHSEVALLTL